MFLLENKMLFCSEFRYSVKQQCFSPQTLCENSLHLKSLFTARADLMCLIFSSFCWHCSFCLTLSTESHRLRWDHVTLILRCGRHIGHPRCLPSSPDSPGSTLTQWLYSLWCRFGSLCPCFVCVEILVLSTNNCYHHATKDWSCTSHFPDLFCWLSCRRSSHLELRISQLLAYVESVRVFVCWKVFGRLMQIPALGIQNGLIL